MARRPSSLFSKIMTVIMVLACLGAALWFGSQVLEPVFVPPPPVPKAKIRFNPNVDVSNNSVFQRLEPLSPFEIEPGVLGRVNPFAPVVPPAAPTSTSPTSTSAVPVEESPLPLPVAPLPEMITSSTETP